MPGALFGFRDSFDCPLHLSVAGVAAINGEGSTSPSEPSVSALVVHSPPSLRRDFGSLGIFIVVGMKPTDRTKLWCETVGGILPSEVWSTFVDLLEGAGSDVRPQVTGPFAFALEAVLGAGPATSFPEGPKAWVQAAQSATEPIEIPDDLFRKVFPD